MLEKQYRNQYLHNILKGLIAETSPVSLVEMLLEVANKEFEWAETEQAKESWYRKANLLNAMLKPFEENK